MDRESRKKILIIKPGAIGDLIQMTPVIRALAVGYPGAQISLLVGNEATAALFRFNPYVAETLVYDKRGEHRSFPSLLKLWKSLRAGNYDLVLNFQRSNLKAWLLVTAAFPCRVLVYHKARHRTVHVVDNYLETLAPLGLQAEGRTYDRYLELYPGSGEEGFAENLFAEKGLTGKTVIALNPGASFPIKCWGTDQFAELANLLHKRIGAGIIIIGGKEDVLLAEQIASATPAKPLMLAGRLTLLQAGAVLKKCALLVSGDTGPLHLATAVGTRVIGLFGAIDPARTGPVGIGHRVIQAKGVPCIPCRKKTCTNNRHLVCMKGISAREVAAAVEEMLTEKDGGRPF